MNGHIRLADFGSCLKLMEDGTVSFYHIAADASSGLKQTYQSFTDLFVNPQGSPRRTVWFSCLAVPAVYDSDSSPSLKKNPQKLPPQMLHKRKMTEWNGDQSSASVCSSNVNIVTRLYDHLKK